MTYKDAMCYIETAGLLGSKPGLSRIKELCSLLGDPQESVKFVHIAGTNGKGSVSAMLSAILISAGYKTGVFTSPHLTSFEERITINGVPVPKRRLAGIIEKIKLCTDKMSDKPTEFEIATAAAFLFFKEENCDIAVLETGLGGRLDSTNVIKEPVLSVITGIALDHTAILGDTYEKIAFEKGGIIKESRPLVLADCPPAAVSVLEDIAKQKRAPLLRADGLRRKNVSVSLDGTEFDFEPYGRISLSLTGVYQADNACTAITAAEALRREGFGISDEAIINGLKSARWPARFEILSKDPLIVYDGAHNPQGAAALAENLRLLGIESAVMLSGVMADKDYRLFAETLSPFAKEAFTVAPDSPRALSPAALADTFAANGVAATPCETVKIGVVSALAAAKKAKLPLIICGSLYMYADVTRCLK